VSTPTPTPDSDRPIRKKEARDARTYSRWYRVADSAAAFMPKGMGSVSGLAAAWVTQPGRILATGMVVAGMITDIASTWWERYKQRKAAEDEDRRTS
jgi:hypothetical protein